jgi:MFS family permease
MTAPAKSKSTSFGRTMALAAAFLGWMFDGFEMGLFPLAGRPALADLLAGQADGALDMNKWFAVIIATFLVGAATGGVLFGWLGDKLGRVKAMALSIFTYAIFTGLCGFATEAWHIAGLRFVASLGMGGEWSLGVALVNELWPGKSRAWIAGMIGAAANVGFLLVGLFSLVMLEFLGGLQSTVAGWGVPETIVDALFRNGGWRLLMISGAFPAFLIFLIRLFVPESEAWEEERAKGATSHWDKAELRGVAIGGVAALLIIWAWSPLWPLGTPPAIAVTLAGLGVVFWGFLHPVRGYLTRAVAAGSLPGEEKRRVVRHLILGAGLAGVALIGTWGSIQWAPKWADELTDGDLEQRAKEYTQIAIALGAILMSFLAPIIGDLLGRRITYTVLCLGSIAGALSFYQLNDSFGSGFLVGAFIAGGITASFYGFFPLYFPELFPTSVRATGQGFCFNVGRVVAAIGGLQTATIAGWFDNNFAQAGSVLCGIYLVGIFIIWLGPETKGQALR